MPWVGEGIALAYSLSYTRTRWNVEPYHKSLKQKASLEKSYTQTVTTQTDHLLAALYGYIKTAFSVLRQLQPIRLAA